MTDCKHETQTRERAILMASLNRTAMPPAPTHCRNGSPAGLFGPGLLPWVSMAEALGWDGVDRPGKTVCGNRAPHWMYEAGPSTGWTLRTGNSTKGGTRPGGLTRGLDEPALTVDSMAMQWALVNGNQPHAAIRRPDEPAPTIHFGHNLNEVAWVAERPSTTVCATPRIGRPGHKRREDGEQQFAEESVRVSLEEAAILQGFRPDYPFQGTKTKRFEQVGNAIPPPMAAAIARALA